MRLSEEIKKHLENYKVEDLYLKNISDKSKNDRYRGVWDGLTVATPKETKISFISKVYNCDFKYILDLCEKYKNAINSGIIKKNSDKITLNKTSVKAWLKKEDTKEYFNINSTFTFGRCKKIAFTLTDRRTEEDILRNIFREALSSMYYKEIQYFNTHDVYKVEENKYRNNINKYGSLGLDIVFSSEGILLGKDEETIFDFNRKFTIDELKYLNNKYETLTQYIDSLSQEVKNNISYNNKDIEENKDEDIDLD
jgi:hypothetical protein